MATKIAAWLELTDPRLVQFLLSDIAVDPRRPPQQAIRTVVAGRQDTWWPVPPDEPADSQMSPADR